MPFLPINTKVCKKEKALFSSSIIIQKKRAKASNAGRGCCSKEL
jgi:hypothetical protein